MSRGKSTGTSSVVIAAAIVIALAADGSAPKEVQLLPMGQINMADGRGPYLLENLVHAERVVEATRKRLGGRHFNYDYDHQAIAAAKLGGATAPASGWIDPAKIVAREDGIWAEVDWTPSAAAAIAAREYRYTSPVFHVDTEKRVLFLTNAALTNNPAIDMPAVAAAYQETGEDMNFKAIAAALGLPEDADEVTILAAIQTAHSAVAAGGTALGAIAAAAGVSVGETSEATATAITTAIAAAKTTGAPDPTKFVPVETFDQLRATVNELQGDRIAASVQSAISGGKLAPANEQWGKDFAAKDPAGWATWVAGAPTIVAAGSQIEGKKIEPSTNLTADEVAACEMTGMSQADYLAAKNEGIA